MFQDALQNAVDGVWANTIGQMVAIVPDWAYWLVALAMAHGVALILGILIGRVWERFGLLGVLGLGIPILLAWLAGRQSKNSDKHRD